MLKMLKFVFTQNNLWLSVGFYSVCSIFVIGGSIYQDVFSLVWGSVMVFLFWVMNAGMWFKDNKGN